MQIFQLSVTFIVSFLLITNLSYVRILLLLSLTVIILKIFFFFSRYAFFPYVYHRSLRAVISYQATMAK